MPRLRTRVIRGDDELRQFFDEVALDYREQHGDPEKQLRERLAVIQPLIGSGAERTLLEIGCGTGIHLFALGQQFARIIGVDISPRMIEQASTARAGRSNPEKYTLAVDRAERLSSIGDESIDVALCVGAFEHMTDKIGVLKQVQRVLKAGGCFVCLTLNADSLWYRRWAPFFRIDTRHLSTDCLVSLADVRDALNAVGLELTESGNWSFVPRGDAGPVISRLLGALDRAGRGLGWPALRGGLFFRAIKTDERQV
ncbi:MAG: class I SAM-dependent methyltransferase [Gammaproteobacteria bacterium]